jgi:hypothetical protein
VNVTAYQDRQCEGILKFHSRMPSSFSIKYQ